jgi:hypothetical protein
MAKTGPGSLFQLIFLSHKHGSNKAQTTNYEHANTQDVFDKN